jgi:CheY-like chemotaxis protein
MLNSIRSNNIIINPTQTMPGGGVQTVVQSVGKHADGFILVMDDEEIIREMTTELLAFLGYQTRVCEDGAEAVELYKTAKESGMPVSAVIMDLTISGGMGVKEAAELILAFDPAACLIVSSGYSNDPIMSDHSKYGFKGAVVKPYKVAELRQLLSSLPAVP